jgi:hypothetical protein
LHFVQADEELSWSNCVTVATVLSPNLQVEVRYHKSHKDRKLRSSAVDKNSVMASDPCMGIIFGPALLPDPVVVGSSIFVATVINPENSSKVSLSEANQSLVAVLSGCPAQHACMVTRSAS